MDFKTLIKERYSVREYLSKKVEKSVLLELLESVRFAPSAVNAQAWRIVIVQDEKKDALSSLYNKEGFKEAPVHLVICADYEHSWVRPFDKKNHGDIDASILVDHITLQAAEMGLGTCWVCYFDAKKCREILNIPETIEPVAILPLGYPKSLPPKEKKRKPLDDILVWESF